MDGDNSSDPADRNVVQLRIIDNNGTAIENATVIAEGSSIIDESVTDGQGKASITIEETSSHPTLSLLVTRVGYENKSIPVPDSKYNRYDKDILVELSSQSIHPYPKISDKNTTRNGNGHDNSSMASNNNDQDTESQQEQKTSITDSVSQHLSERSNSPPSRQDLISEIQRIDNLTDGCPTTTEISDEGKFSPEQYYQEFDTWDQALEAAGIDKESRLIQDIQNVAEIVGKKPTTVQVDLYGDHSSEAHIEHFSSWDSALETASVENVEAKDNNPKNGEKPDPQSSQRESKFNPLAQRDQNTSEETPTRDDLIDELQRLDSKVDVYPRKTQVRTRGQYNPQQYYTEFDSWEGALEAANINKRKRLVEEIRRVAKFVDSRPTTTDMNEHGNISSATCSEYFGSWFDALDAVESEQGLQDVINNSSPTSTGKSSTSTTTEDRSTERSLQSDSSGIESVSTPVETADKNDTTQINEQVKSSKFANLTGFQRDLLVVLADGNIHKGLDIKSELESYYGDDEIHHGRLYPNLDTLVDKELIEKTIVDGRSNGYSLSQEGENQLIARQRWKSNLLDGISTSSEKTNSSRPNNSGDSNNKGNSGDDDDGSTNIVDDLMDDLLEESE